MKEVVILAAARTPIGKFGGGFTTVGAVELGRTAASAVYERAGIDPAETEEVLIGNVLSAGLGQNVARQVSLAAGLPDTVPAMTVNKVCGSGLRTVSLAAQIIRAGDADLILAGGTENMSRAPYLMEKHRWGERMGDGVIVDSMIRDGLWDIFNNYHMGITAENIAESYGLSREEQDIFAASSQQKTEAAMQDGCFARELVPVEIPQRKGDPLVMDTDEFPRPAVTAEALGKLKPAFKKDGTVTAGNSSGINDGAAMLLIASAEKAEELGAKPLARIVSYGSGALDPAYMGLGPIPSTKKTLQKAGLGIDDMDLVEANEAFAAQSLAVLRDLELDSARVNVNGGAISLGHPIGASGARILVTLLYALRARNGHYGLATLCIGGGQGAAVIVEML